MSARDVSRHAVWNVFGQAAPLLFAVVVLPQLVSRLGLDRYGFLTLVWVLVGYVGVFDFGVGRAVTRVVAERLGSGDEVGAHDAARAALGFLLTTGVVLGGTLLLLAPQVAGLLALPPALHDEGVNALRILALSLPFVLLTSGYRGYLEARRAFAALNLIRVGMGLFTYLAPLAATLLSPRLESLVLAVLIMRMVANYVHRRACFAQEAASLGFERPTLERLKPLLSLGGWITVSNVVGPLMGSLDRLLIGTLVPIAAIGMYATAFDVVTKALIVAYSLTGASFPLFAGMKDARHAGSLYVTFVKVMLLLVWPLLFTLSLFAQPMFTLWLGPDFARVAAPSLQILAVGLMFNCLAQLPAMFIQSRGSPKWMAMLHLIEMPVFLAVIYLLTSRFGVLGTAAAWSLRVAVDSIVLFALVAKRLAPGAIGVPLAITTLLLAPMALLLPFFDMDLAARAGLGVAAGVAFFGAGWAWLLDARERAQISGLVLVKFGGGAR